MKKNDSAHFKSKDGSRKFPEKAIMFLKKNIYGIEFKKRHIH
jgi:hypothetical protein